MKASSVSVWMSMDGRDGSRLDFQISCLFSFDHKLVVFDIDNVGEFEPAIVMKKHS
jgi:hypothetical protein